MKTTNKLSHLFFLACLVFFGQIASAQTCISADYTFVNNNPNEVQFTDASNYGANLTNISYFWTFGNGASSTLVNPLATFSGIGNYTVCLQIAGFNTQTNTTCRDTICKNVSVTNGTCNIQTTFTHNTNPNGVSIITGQATGGNAPYTYQVVVNGQLQNVSSFPYTAILQPGLNQVCVIAYDALQCADSSCQSITVGANCQNFLTAITQSLDSATGLTTFSAIPSGGNSPYNYAWSNGQSTQSVSAPPQSYFFVTVTDAQGCTVTARDSNYNNPCQNSSLTVTISQFIDSIGTVTLNAIASGGGGQYTYSWSNGSNFNSISNLSGGTYCVTIQDQNGCNALSCYSYQPNLTDTICGVVFYDTNNNGVFDGNDSVFANREVCLLRLGSGIYNCAVSDVNGYYQVAVAPDTYSIYARRSLQGIDISSVPLDTIFGGLPVYNNVVISGGGIHCGYNFGFTDQRVVITGYVYNDNNNNGLRDGGETGVPYVYVNVGGQSVYTDANGFYTIVVAAGTYTLSHTPSGAYAGHSVLPSSRSVVATTVGNTYANNDFGIYIVPGTCNVAITLYQISTVTPGFEAWYGIQVTNVGATVASGTLDVLHSAVLTYNSALPVPASTTSSSISWNVPALAPGSSAYYRFYLNTPTTVSLGQAFLTFAQFNTTSCNDINLANNTDSVHQVAVGSWDPNDKQVWPLGEGINGRIRPETPSLDYLIRFQNTGTAPAVNVVLIDTLSAELDWSSLRMNGTSHSCNASISSAGILVIKYPNIMLPDSNANEPESHGHFAYTINLKPNRPNGTVINNTAHIYFDFNEAVVTNTTVNTIDIALSIKDEIAATISLHPNPFTTYTTLKVEDANLENLELLIFDITGKSLKSITSSNGIFKIERDNLNTGLYIYQLHQAGKKIATGKLIAE